MFVNRYLEKIIKRSGAFYTDYKIQQSCSRNGRNAGNAKIDNFLVHYLDALSFYHEYNDIFKSRIYDFNAQVEAPFIIDAGSCIGMSVLFFKQKYQQARVLAFEPDPIVYSCLLDNLKNNNVENVTAINSALGSDYGKSVFYADGSDGGSMSATIGAKSICVLVERLSDYMAEPVDLLKMNIEGMEGIVFEEIAHKLELVKEIIFEYHAFHNLPQSLGMILNLLDSKGFRYLVTDATNAKIQIPFNLSKDYKCFNLVYAKNSRYF